MSLILPAPNAATKNLGLRRLLGKHKGIAVQTDRLSHIRPIGDKEGRIMNEVASSVAIKSDAGQKVVSNLN